MKTPERSDAAWDLPEALAAHVDPAYRSFAGQGWRSILERLHDRLLAIDPDYRLHQVKEKMGILRIYAAHEDTPSRRSSPRSKPRSRMRCASRP